jgi:GNAT superfamily N-acetyltransferase
MSSILSSSGSARRAVGVESIPQRSATSVRVRAAVVESPSGRAEAVEQARSPFLVTHARAGDHQVIQHLLVQVLRGPSAGEFQAALDRPEYDPGHRLLVKLDEQPLAHVQLVRREIYFGAVTLPVTDFVDAAVLPEYRSRGLANVLLPAAERVAADNGAMLLTARTETPGCFIERAWAVCGRHSYSSVSPRDLLAKLHADRKPIAIPWACHAAHYHIRHWRHVEQDALTRLYAENSRGTYGPPLRGDEYWRWLVVRRAYDQIYVAIQQQEGTDPYDLRAGIVAYAAVKDGRIVELIDSGATDAGLQLIARACADAIERDQHVIRLHAPPHHPRHAWIREAGGQHVCAEVNQAESLLAKVIDPRRLLERLAPELYQRARRSGITRGTELGLQIGRHKIGLQVTTRSVRVVSGRLGRSYVRLSYPAATQLLLGHTDIALLVETGAAKLSTRVALDFVRGLFSQVPFWRPPLDDLEA